MNIGLLTKLVKSVYSKPIARALGLGIGNVIGSIVISSWINAVSKTNEFIVWELVTRSWWTLILILYIAIVLLYAAGDYWYENRIMKWNDPSFVRAKFIDDIWEQYVSVMRDRIQNKEFSDFQEIVQDVERLKNV